MADPRLIVGLDVPSIGQARQIVDELGDAVSFYKIGHQLAYAPEKENGFHLARELIDQGKQVFLDFAFDPAEPRLFVCHHGEFFRLVGPSLDHGRHDLVDRILVEVVECLKSG